MMAESTVDSDDFLENEKILCYQGPFMYEAKCLKPATEIEGKIMYFVHYNGWNKSHDEWVTRKRMLKFNPENVAKQKQLVEQYKKEKQSQKSKVTVKPKAKPEKAKEKQDEKEEENEKLNDKEKNKVKSKTDEIIIDKEKNKEREKSKDAKKTKDKEKSTEKEKSKNKEKTKDKEKAKDKLKDKEKSKDKSKEKEKHKEKQNDKSKNKDKSKTKEVTKYNEPVNEKLKDKSNGKEKSKDTSKESSLGKGRNKDGLKEKQKLKEVSKDKPIPEKPKEKGKSKEKDSLKSKPKQEISTTKRNNSPVNVEPPAPPAKRLKILDIFSGESDEYVDPFELSLKRTLNFTVTLKNALSDDWDFIMRQKRVPHLPARATVEFIIADFLKTKEPSLDSEAFSKMRYAFRGMIELFNVMLSSKLLYKFERPQFGEMLDLYPGKTPCQIYGFCHFVRFFVQLQKKLWEASPHDPHTEQISGLSQQCLDFLDKMSSVYHSWLDYDTVPAEYHRRAIT